AHVAWKTDVPCPSAVKFWPVARPGQTRTRAPDLAPSLEHVLVLRDLEADTDYAGVVIRRDGFDGQTSDEFRFRTGSVPRHAVLESHTAGTSAALRWTTPAPAPTEIRYGVAPWLDHRAGDPGAGRTTDHALTLTGLKEATWYDCVVS